MIRKRINSFGFALKGIRSAFRSEVNIRIQMLLGILTVATGLYFNISSFEWNVIVLCIVLVLSAELFNTAIEKILDHVSPEHHPRVGYIKDISAGAVLLITFGAFVSGLIIFLPRFVDLLIK